MILGQGHRSSVETLGAVSYFAANIWGYTINANSVSNVGISVLVVAGVLFAFGFFLMWKPRRTSILGAVTCLYLLIFAFTYWEPQFLLNLLPLLTIFCFTSGARKLPFLIFVSSALAFVLLDFGYYLASWGHSFFFVPNYNEVLQHYSDLFIFIRNWPIGRSDVSALITSPVRSVFVATALYYFIWIALRNSKQNLRRIIGR